MGPQIPNWGMEFSSAEEGPEKSVFRVCNESQNLVGEMDLGEHAAPAFQTVGARSAPIFAQVSKTAGRDFPKKLSAGLVEQPIGDAREGDVSTAGGSFSLRDPLKGEVVEQGDVEDEDVKEASQEGEVDGRRVSLSEDEHCGAAVAELDPSGYFYQAGPDVLKKNKTESMPEPGGLLEEKVPFWREAVETVQVSELQKAPGRKSGGCASEQQSSRLPLLKDEWNLFAYNSCTDPARMLLSPLLQSSL
ncbi:UNVERIFIED_CONTAM: hypothetical protein K2H54_013316 [Gekko kuhli]